MSINRRRLLKFGLGFAIASNYSVVEKSSSIAFATSPNKIILQAWTADGQPLDSKKLDQLYFLTLDDEPTSEFPRTVESGKLISECPNFPFAIALRSLVTGFGEVVLYADNQGKGYTAGDFPLNLNFAFAQTRLYRVREYLKRNSFPQNIFSEGINSKLDKAQQYLDNAQTNNILFQQIAWCNFSLFESLWAGEIAVFEQAKFKIKTQGKRSDFLFGSRFVDYSADSEEYIPYNRQFRELFNFATIPFYWRSFETEKGIKEYARVDKMVNWLADNNIVVKGHPLVYFHAAGIPEWLKDQPFSAIKEQIAEHIFEVTHYYQDKIPYYDIINEANKIPWANELNYSTEQFLELTRIAADSSVKGYPEVQRIINHCCAWGENVAYGKPPQDSPYKYLQKCIAAEIPFEIVGLQVYYPNQDMFEINRLLERYRNLGKPIHITELSVSSATTIDETSQLQEPKGLWHKPWSEAIQADWLEQFYTLCYSKPYIKAISCWDFTDQGNFWPHGGLLNRKMQAKQSFYRLSRLIRRWRSSTI